MPFSIPSAIPSIYESESLILPYHHRVEYLLDLTSERPFNLTRISDAPVIPIKNIGVSLPNHLKIHK